MKKTVILGLAAAITLTAVSAFAGSDEQYPAANFQPKVIYADKEAVSHKGTAAADDNNKCKESKAETTAQVEFDPKYPAAYFQPKVIYP